MINVTKPFLPPLEEYRKYLDGIWERNWLTNMGPLSVELEEKLKQYLDVRNHLYLSNGTIAIQFAIKALGLKGKIITTPFSYVATTSSIVWESCQPVFVDIDPETYNMDPSRIEASVDKDTTGIVATHCFGNACDIDAIEAIARKHNLKIIYDAAHCFGVRYKGRSVFSYGDVSTVSYHATKIFHTIEGGAVFAKDQNVFNTMHQMRNFGHLGPGVFTGIGVNAKNSEFHSAMGLCLLKHIDDILRRRKEQYARYVKLLQGSPVRLQKITAACDHNFSFFPVLFESHEKMLSAQRNLEANNISPRRYFYPSLSTLDYVARQKTPVSDDIAERILCLPLYHDMSADIQERMVSLMFKK